MDFRRRDRFLFSEKSLSAKQVLSVTAEQRPVKQTDRALDETIAPEVNGDTDSDGQFTTEAIPQDLGRYKIKRLLGRGGMGAVYLAHDSQLRRDVALKVPKFSSGTHRKQVERFYREARSAANLSHPNLCPVFDVGEIDGTHYIAMALIKGKPLSSYVNPNKPPASRVAATIVRKVAIAMEDAHQSGILHRDLKPANIMIDHRKEPIVMDFGLACPQDVGAESRLTRDGMLLGSPAYMSPEQLGGNTDEVGPASDVYALGVVLYELLTGRLPFEGVDSTIALLGKILTQQPEDVTKIRGDIAPALAAICRKSMAKKTADRYPSMERFAADLGKYLQSGTTRASAGSLSGPSRKDSALQIRLSEQTRVAKTLIESGQFAAATQILEQMVASPEPDASKVRKWAQTMLLKVQARARIDSQTRTQPIDQNDLFANLPPANSTPSAPITKPFPRPTPKSTLYSTPLILASVAGLATLILIGGLALFMRVGREEIPATVTDSPTTNRKVNTRVGNANVSPHSIPIVKDSPVDTVVADSEHGSEHAIEPGAEDWPTHVVQLLRRFDHNQDGYLDAQEIPIDRASLMMRADANEDQRLSRQEIATLPSPPDGFRPPEFDAPPNPGETKEMRRHGPRMRGPNQPGRPPPRGGRRPPR